MSEVQKENLIKNVVREISQECHLKGLAVSESLALFIIKAVILHPKNKFNIDKPTTREDLDRLNELCIERLTKDPQPSLDTIKMQIYFDENYVDRDTFEKEDVKSLDCQLSSKLNDITSRVVEGCKEQECLYRKIIRYMMYKSELGCPSDENLMREFAAALSSVLPISELKCFLNLSKSKREERLIDLTSIVVGLLLSEKDWGKGGECIEDVTESLNDLIPTTATSIDEKISDTEKKLEFLSGILEYYRATDRDLPELLASKTKQSVINCCQHLIYLKLLKKNVNKSALAVDQAVTNLAMIIKNMSFNRKFSNRNTFPLYSKLASAWAVLMMERKYIHLLGTMLLELDEFAKLRNDLIKSEEMAGFESLMKEGSLKLTKTLYLYHKGFNQKLQRIHNIPKNDDVKVLYPETTGNYSRLPLQFRGYCCWTLVNRDIFLIPGNPDLGLIYYKGCCYAFTSNRAAIDFVTDPLRYLNGVAELACLNPELIHLLELYHLFSSLLPRVQREPIDESKLEQPLLMSEVASQTDTHFQDNNIVTAYEWNEWQLRRMAIRLANLRNKRSKATQTKMSNMRRDIFTQVYRRRSTETQTKIDAGSNVPRPQTFLAGLRGTNPTNYKKVDLTLRDDEDYDD